MAVYISYSRFSSYLRCPYLHYLRYYEKLNSNMPARPLHFGSDFHKLLEVRTNKSQVKKEWRRMRDEFYGMPASWQSELGFDYPTDIKTIFQDYMKKWEGTPLPDETEHKFELDIDKFKDEKIVFVGVIDELYKYDDNIDIGEHKTFTKQPDMNTLVMNSQKSLYCKATEMLWGKLPKKVRWDYIKSTPAKYPVWLEKSNRFSIASSKDITYESWLRACKEKNITDAKTLEQGKTYEENSNNYFFRVEQDVYPEMVEGVFDGFKYTCRDIVYQGATNKTKNLTRDCSWCEYRDICMAEMSGGDREYVISEKFIRKED